MDTRTANLLALVSLARYQRISNTATWNSRLVLVHNQKISQDRCGIYWADVDVVKMEVAVRRSCVRNRMGDTKTEASRGPFR